MSDYVTLPSNSDAAMVLSAQADVGPVIADEGVIQVGKYYVTLITEGNVDAWYIALHDFFRLVEIDLNHANDQSNQ